MAISRLKPEDRTAQLAGMQRRLQQYVIGQPFTGL